MRYLVYLCTYSPGFIATVKTGGLQEMAVTIQNLNFLFQIQLKKNHTKNLSRITIFSVMDALAIFRLDRFSISTATGIMSPGT